jgi:hypothetical protein
MEIYMMTMRCNECENTIRVGHLQPRTTVEAPQYCVYCASNRTIVYQDIQQDCWEAYARSYSLPISVVKTLYSMWDHHEHSNFGDFVRTMQKEAKEMKSEAVT